MCGLEPLNPLKHGDDLFAAYSLADARFWTYTFDEPFTSVDELRTKIKLTINSKDLDFAVINLQTNKAVGQLALKRADPINGTVEVGRATFSPLIQGSILSTEAQYLLMTYVFDQISYRRYEARCESYNQPAHKTITRLGFTLEGVFRNFCVFKGCSSDAKCFSVIDSEWRVLKSSMQTWLAPDNFDEQGRQIRRLEDIRRSIERKIQGFPSNKVVFQLILLISAVLSKRKH